MVLFDDVVEMLHLPYADRRFASGIDLILGRCIGAAVVHRDLLGDTAGLHGFVKKAQGCSLIAPGRQQEVDRLAFLVHGAVERFPGALDLEGGDSSTDRPHTNGYTPESRFNPVLSKYSA